MDTTGIEDRLDIIIQYSGRLEDLFVLVAGVLIMAFGLWCQRIVVAGRGRIDKG